MDSETDMSHWVDGRMASLDPSTAWQPNATLAMARLKSWQGDHLERLLPHNVEPPWFVGIWNNLREMLHPEKLPPLELTSKPIPVKDIWGLYRPTGSPCCTRSHCRAFSCCCLQRQFQQDSAGQSQETVTLIAPVLQPLEW